MEASFQTYPSLTINREDYTYFGRAWRNGEFKKIDKTSLEYFELWEEQYKRCIEGYSVGGVHISGLMYFYINFGTISKLDNNTNTKKLDIPDFRDVEYAVDLGIQRAMNEGKSLQIFSGRRIGKTCIGSAGNAWASTIMKQVTFIGAGTSDKIQTAYGMARQHINGLRETEFRARILRQKVGERNGLQFGYEVKNSETNKYEPIYTGGDLIAVNFWNKHTAANGIESYYAFVDEIGMFNNYKKAYGSMKHCWKEGGKNYGFSIHTGTGGDMGAGTEDAAEMYWDPDTYEFVSFKDEERAGAVRGMFIPGYYSKTHLRDDNGNVDKFKGKEEILLKREQLRKAKDSTGLAQQIAYEPLVPDDCFLRFDQNQFPVELIRQRLDDLVRNPSLRKVTNPTPSYLVMTKAGVQRVKDESRVILDYPVKGIDDKTGALAVWESPVKNTLGTVPTNLYTIGFDPYRFASSSSSPSLGSVFVYKRVWNPLQGMSNYPVAEYTGRPRTLEDFYEQVLLLSIWYNTVSSTLFESNIPGFRDWMKKHKGLKYLATSPRLIEKTIKQKETVGNSIRHGLYMTADVKMYMLQLISNWLKTPLESEDGYNIDKVFSIPLLKELLNYNETGNFDRVVAFGLALIQDEELYQTTPGNSKYANTSKQSDIMEYFRQSNNKEYFV